MYTIHLINSPLTESLSLTREADKSPGFLELRGFNGGADEEVDDGDGQDHKEH